MRTHRFGRRIKLPSTTAIKHQVRMLMARDEIARAEADARAAVDARAEAFRGRDPGEQAPLVE